MLTRGPFAGCADFYNQVFEAERFAQQDHLIGEAVLLQVFGNIPRHKEHFHVGAENPSPLGQFDPIHLWHNDIGDHEMDHVRVIRANRECLIAVVGLDDQISVETQQIANYLEDRLFILNEKDCFQDAPCSHPLESGPPKDNVLGRSTDRMKKADNVQNKDAR